MERLPTGGIARILTAGCVAADAFVVAGRQVSAGPSGRCVSSAGQGWEVRWFKQQRGVTRYNCADSLDRTNVGSFFGAVQVRCIVWCAV